jgi:uncharacterized protein YutE (UPF0331/DUF86 family)
MPADDVSLNKAAIIERSIRRMREEFAADPHLRNYTRIDAMTLNVERACQAAIDLAMHIVAVNHLGMPQSMGEAFGILRQNGYIAKELELKLRGMVGFRNIAIHQYQELELNVLKWIAEDGWRDLVLFCAALDLRIEP